MRLALAFVLAAGLASAATPVAWAHDGVAHATSAEAESHRDSPGPALPFPVVIRPSFDLIDQTGRAVTQADFAGRPMVIFFGYANCEAICSVALPSLAAALDLLGDDGAEIAPVLITVDPQRDTPEAMAAQLPEYHPRLIGLTGSEAALAEARAVFQIDAKQVTETADGAPVYAHGSFVYLVGRDGEVKSLLPPILSPERMAELMRKYL
jgi:protein SCO1/2